MEVWRTKDLVAAGLYEDKEAVVDYSLRPESPAFRVGFVPIDVSTVGLRDRTAAG